MNAEQRTPMQSKLVKTAAFFMIAAGMLHLAIIAEHWSHAPAHGAILGLSGALELAWGIAFLRSPSSRLYQGGLLASVGLITLWAITRLLPAPFGHGPEAMDTVGVISKLCEGMGATALVALAVSGFFSAEARTTVWRSVGALMVAAVLSGWASYGIGRALEPVFPALTVPAADHHGDHHGDHHENHDQHHGEGHQHGH